MRILFIGGTHFVGRAMVEAAHAAGHDLTLVHRNPAGFPADADHVLADRDGDLSALADGEWDVTIDVCAYVPRQVRTLHDAVGERGGHHVLISTVSVYGDVPDPGAGEDAPLVDEPDESVEEVTAETYGALKVACERVAHELYDDDALTIIRPTFVVGPYDHTGRFPWWVLRTIRGGRMLAPEPSGAPVQVIDARDMGEWTIRLAERRTPGTFIAARPSTTFAELLREIGLALGTEPDLTWADADWLQEHDVGGAAMPLWTEGVPENALAMSPAKAEAAGLRHRPFEQTVRDTLAWARDNGNDDVLVDGVGLSADDEERLLEQWDDR